MPTQTHRYTLIPGRMTIYGPWRIQHNERSGHAALSFGWWHAGFDLENLDDDRCGTAPTLADAVEAIHEWEDGK